MKSSSATAASTSSLEENIMSPAEVRQVTFDEYASDKSLIHAAEQAHARNYKDFLIVDVDSHHYENENYREVFEFIDNPVIRRGALESIQRLGRSTMINGQVGYQDIDGRITRQKLRK